MIFNGIEKETHHPSMRGFSPETHLMNLQEAKKKESNKKT
jgi:hypothetical protein